MNEVCSQDEVELVTGTLEERVCYLALVLLLLFLLSFLAFFTLFAFLLLVLALFAATIVFRCIGAFRRKGGRKKKKGKEEAIRTRRLLVLVWILQHVKHDFVAYLRLVCLWELENRKSKKGEGGKKKRGEQNGQEKKHTEKGA